MKSNGFECFPTKLYQIKLKEKYEGILLSKEPYGIVQESAFDLLSANIDSDNDFHDSNSSLISSHSVILRRLLIEDQEYPDFLLNLLEIECMKDLTLRQKILIAEDKNEMFHEKFSLQIVGYHLHHLDSKIQIMDILYITNANEEGFLDLCFGQDCKKPSEKKPIEAVFQKLATKIMNLKSNYFESLDSFCAGLRVFRNNNSEKTQMTFSLERGFNEKHLRSIFLKPLFYIRKALDGKEVPTREFIWFLCFIGKRYHQLKEVRQSLKIFDETYNLRSVEWGENSNETMDSLNRIGCALLRKNLNKNTKVIFDRVHKIRKTLLGETNNLNAISLYNLGITSLNSSNYEEAFAYFSSAINIYSNLTKNYEIKLADCLQALGSSLLKIKKYDESIVKLQESQKINLARINEPCISLKYAQICNTLAIVFDQKREPVNCYKCLLKSFLIFNEIKGERKEVNDYRNRVRKFREENKEFVLIEVGFVIKQKLRPVFRRNLIIEDILSCFIAKTHNFL